MKAVLDTNVLVSAFIFPGGESEDVYRLGLEGFIEIVTSRPLLVEFGRVLGEKFAWRPARTEAAVSRFARIASIVEPRESFRVVAAEPAADRVLEAGFEAKAEFIVSYDKHLLRLETWPGIQIVAPVELLARIRRPTKTRAS